MTIESIEQINYLKAPIATVYNALTTTEGLGQVWTVDTLIFGTGLNLGHL